MQRVVKIQGSVNLRDFGGLPSQYGGHVRRGVLFRSGMMADLDAQAQREFLDLGIEVICDLRHEVERQSDPTPFNGGAPRNVHIPIDPGSHIGTDANHFIDALDHTSRHAFMVGINRDLGSDHAADYRQIFDVLLDLQGGFLIHCTAGKDRTGFGVALILMALGASREDVVEDYLFTNTVMDFENFNLPRLQARYGNHLTLEDARSISGVRIEYLEAALNELEKRHGSVENYFKAGLGLSDPNLDQLREKFLEG